MNIWEFTEDEQKELLGTDIGEKYPEIVVELDEWSKRMFYNRRFAPMTIYQYKCQMRQEDVFQIVLDSIDDTSVNMTWEVKKMDMRPDEARVMLDEWLKRTNYFINLRGLEAFCNIFGKYHLNN
jgi:hypothetical protein